MKKIIDELKEQPFFADFSAVNLELIAGCGKNLQFKAGEKVASEGSPADMFYVIRKGKLAIEIFSPAKPPLVCQTLVDGQICGWSWLFEPYKWTFDVVASENTRVVALDGKCLREKCEKDHEFGYLLMKKFSQSMTDRLKHTRLQLMDIYGNTQ